MTNGQIRLPRTTLFTNDNGEIITQDYIFQLVLVLNIFAAVNVRRQLSSTIKKFRFEELESTVIPRFPETSWSQVRSRLVKHHESFTVTNARKIIEKAINVSTATDIFLGRLYSV